MDSYEMKELVQAIKDLASQLEVIKNAKIDPYSSKETKDIYAALAKAQAEYGPMVPTQKGNFGYYASFQDILNAVRPALASNNLAFYQFIREKEDGSEVLHSVLAHATGQWLECRKKLPQHKADDRRGIEQKDGSSLTYYRRYVAAALLGIDDQEEDIDEQPSYAKASEDRPQQTYKPAQKPAEYITAEQKDILEKELAEHPDILKNLLKFLNINELSEMKKDRFQWSFDKIKSIKAIK